MTQSESKYRLIKKQIEEIEQNTAAVDVRKARDSTADSAEQEIIMAEINKIASQTHDIAFAIKQQLLAIKEENNELAQANPNSNKIQALMGLYQHHMRLWHDAINNFQASVRSTK